MGYCIEIERGTFSFDADKADEVLRLIKQGITSGKINVSRWISLNAVLAAETVKGAFWELRYVLELEGDKYVFDYFTGEKLAGYEDQLFSCIAPCMNDGFLEFIGEDGDRWRYVFEKGACTEVHARTVWE